MARKYIVASLINNSITIVLYWLLMHLLLPGPAYIITWIIGMLIVFVLYPVIIFGKGLKIISGLSIKILATYLISLCITLLYINSVEDVQKIFIAISSTLLNGVLNVAFLYIIKSIGRT